MDIDEEILKEMRSLALAIQLDLAVVQTRMKYINEDARRLHRLFKQTEEKHNADK